MGQHDEDRTIRNRRDLAWRRPALRGRAAGTRSIFVEHQRPASSRSGDDPRDGKDTVDHHGGACSEHDVCSRVGTVLVGLPLKTSLRGFYFGRRRPPASVALQLRGCLKSRKGSRCVDFGVGQGASAAPISAAISAKRATPASAKSEATLRARALWAVWPRCTLGHSPLRGCSLACALPDGPKRSRATPPYFLDAL